MRKLSLLIIALSMVVIFGCTKVNTGHVGEPIDIYVDKKPVNVLEYKWAFKNKPIESRLDPRDFIPSDYAETVTFIPDVPGNFEIMVVMVDDHNKEFDKNFKYKIIESTEFDGNYLEDSSINETEQSTQIEKKINAEQTEVSKDKQSITKDEWENVPTLTEKEKKSPRPNKQSQNSSINKVGLYTIQFSSSHHKKYSEIAVNDLIKLGYDAYLQKFYLKNDENPWYRVRVGDFTSLDEAKSVKLSLQRRTHQKGIWIDNK